MKKALSNICFVFLLCVGEGGVAQIQTSAPDISKPERFLLVNRNVNVINNDGRVVVHVNSRPGNGVAWLKDIKFQNGIIEFDAKGKNVLQQSFIGIAFHGLNDSTYDAIYFRPFNFQSDDTVRRSHSVQYISLPQYDWARLREKFPNTYENRLVSTVSPESWFHVRVNVANEITVHVNNDTKPSLVVKPLSDRTNGAVGFWVGNNSDGDFSNLTIQEK